MHLHETSCVLLTGRITVKARYEDLPVSAATMPRMPSTPPLPLGDVIVPLQGKVCRSLLRLDVKEFHFDGCIPGGSFVKDFTVWNRSEIPLLFQLVSSVALFDDARDLLTFTDYNSGYRINGKTVQAAAYGHVRIRVTYRPTEIGELLIEVHVQNLHDSRNAKTLKIHAVTNKEHLRLESQRQSVTKAAAAFASFDSPAGYGADSDDDGDDNEGDFYDEDMTLITKRLSFEENPQGDVDDADDDFEFDREPRPAQS